MTTNNQKEIRIIENGYEFGPYPHGEFAGQPTVSIKLSSANSNATKIGSLDRMFEGWGWKQKVESGYARLRWKGSNPLSEIHTDAIDVADNIINPTFVDFELDQQSITREPSRDVKRIADHFTLFVPTDGSYDDDAMEWFADQSRSHGNVEFLFNVGDYEDDEFVKQFSRDYKIYDSDISLYPRGRKPNTVKDSYDSCVKWAKRNSWNISPRFDVWDGFDVEEEDE